MASASASSRVEYPCSPFVITHRRYAHDFGNDLIAAFKKWDEEIGAAKTKQ